MRPARQRSPKRSWLNGCFDRRALDSCPRLPDVARIGGVTLDSFEAWSLAPPIYEPDLVTTTSQLGREVGTCRSRAQYYMD
jgi:hypothetical protein